MFLLRTRLFLLFVSFSISAIAAEVLPFPSETVRLIFEDKDGHKGTRLTERREASIEALIYKLKQKESSCELIDSLFESRKQWTCDRETGWESPYQKTKQLLLDSPWFRSEGVEFCRKMGSLDAQNELKKAIDDGYSKLQLLEVARKYPFRIEGVTASLLTFRLLLEEGDYLSAAWGLEELVQRLEKVEPLRRQMVPDIEAWARLLFQTSLAFKRSGQDTLARTYYKKFESFASVLPNPKLKFSRSVSYSLDELKEEWNRTVAILPEAQVSFLDRFYDLFDRKKTDSQAGRPLSQIDVDTEIYEYLLLNHLPRIHSYHQANVSRFTLFGKGDLAYELVCAESIRMQIPVTAVVFTSVNSIKMWVKENHEEALQNLGRHPHLTLLDLRVSRLSPNEMSEIAKLSQLKVLRLPFAEISNAGMKQLRNLENLTELEIPGTKMTDASVIDLLALTSLQSLDISHNELSDNVLQHLKELKNLKTLKVRSNRKITDKSLAYLREFKNLSSLELRGTLVTQEGLNQFKMEMPKLEVIK